MAASESSPVNTSDTKLEDFTLKVKTGSRSLTAGDKISEEAESRCARLS